MKFSQVSGLLTLLLAAGAAAAPQHAVGSDFVKRDKSEPLTVVEAFDQISDAQHHAPQRRADSEDRSDLPTVKDAVDQVFAAQSHAIQKRYNENLEEEVSSILSKETSPEMRNKYVQNHPVRYACQSGGNSKKVSPDWLGNQTEKMIQYLTQPRLMPVPVSTWFKAASAGLDWKGNQDGQQNTNTHDWVYMTVAWFHYGNGGAEMSRSAAMDLLKDGLNMCQTTPSEGPRTRGFVAEWNNEWAFYLYAGNQNNKQAEATAGADRGLKWQKPETASVTPQQWAEFIPKEENTYREPSEEPESESIYHDEP